MDVAKETVWDGTGTERLKLFGVCKQLANPENPANLLARLVILLHHHHTLSEEMCQDLAMDCLWNQHHDDLV